MKIVVCMAAFVLLEAGVSAAVPNVDVFDDVRRISICVVGAMIGAMLTVAIVPQNTENEKSLTRRLAMKFGASALGGVAFAPAIMQWIGLPKSADYLMGCSAGTAAVVVSVLHVIQPLIAKAAVGYVNWRLGNGSSVERDRTRGRGGNPKGGSRETY